MKLTDEHKEAMGQVRDGADVFSHATATLLREVERNCPEFITICKPMGHYGSGVTTQPYLGAILTSDGKRALL